MSQPSDEVVYSAARAYLKDYLNRHIPMGGAVTFYPEISEPNFPIAANSFVMMISQEKLSYQTLKIQESNTRLQKFLALFAGITVAATVANILIAVLH